jgi:arginase
VEEIQKLGVPVHTVEIDPVDEFEGEIGRSFELLRRVSKAVASIVATKSFPLILSGNCMTSTAVAAGLGGEDIGFVWIDAHDDLDTPSVNTNGYLDAMGVSMLNGQSWHALMETVPGHTPLTLDKFVYCGLRDVSDVQRQRVADAKVDVVWGNSERKQAFCTELEKILKMRSFSPAVVHLDLDVLDESLGAANEYPSPGGFLESDLQEVLAMVPANVIPASLTVCSFNANLEAGDKIAQIAVRGITTFVQSLINQKHLQRQ